MPENESRFQPLRGGFPTIDRLLSLFEWTDLSGSSQPLTSTRAQPVQSRNPDSQPLIAASAILSIANSSHDAPACVLFSYLVLKVTPTRPISAEKIIFLLTINIENA